MSRSEFFALRPNKPALGQKIFEFRCDQDNDEFLKARKQTTQFLLKHKEIYYIREDWSIEEYRAHVHAQMKFFMENAGLLTVQVVKEQLPRFLGILDALLCYDVSLAAKAVIHTQLFGSTIYDLGTERHHNMLFDAINNMSIMGSFSMTEIGHGSNVRELRTTATYDINTDEFVINTPDDLAVKFWIGNTAVYGTTTVVFARLITHEGVDHGVNAFVVQLRNPKTMELTKGVQIWDIGAKNGWNGVDNGAIRFNNVRIPRENLLNKLGDLDRNGVFHSSIENEGKRFGATLAALMFGRLLYVCGPTRGLELGLNIASIYGNQRRQFGNAGSEETIIMDYPTHQRKIMPMIASSYAFFFTRKYLAEQFDVIKNKPNSPELAEYHAVISGIKAYIAEYVPPQLGTLRVMCGGHGVLSANRLGGLQSDFDIFQTAEGDSTVLYQQLGRYLVIKYQRQFSGSMLSSAMKFASQTFDRFVLERNPISTRNSSERHLLDSQFYVEAFNYRLAVQIHKAAMKLKASLQSSQKDYFKAWSTSLNEIVAASKAYVHCKILQLFVDAINNHQGDAKVHKILKHLLDLYALSNIENDFGFYMKRGYIKPAKARAISKLVVKRCAQLRPHVEDLVEAFDIPDELLRAPIGKRNRDYVKNLVEYVSVTNASPKTPPHSFSSKM